MTQVLEFYPWGNEWSPITIVPTGTVITTVYYPHKATADAVLMYKGHPIHCITCGQDVDGTKPHTRRQFVQGALFKHLVSHGRRTKKRNKFIESKRVSP